MNNRKGSNHQFPYRLRVACLAFSLLFSVATQADEPAPFCELSAVNGPALTDWAVYAGKVVYVDFWASWCLPCLRSFPFMMELVDEIAQTDLQIIAVNLDASREQAMDFLYEFGLATDDSKIQVMADIDGNCARDFGVSAMPSSYLIDRSGNVRYEHKGFRPADEADLKLRVQTLVDEQK
jgi:thiol-disulfide isomerase/thioredoxin